MDNLKMLEDTIKDLESILFDSTIEAALLHYSKINARAIAPKEMLQKIKLLKDAARTRPRRTK